MWCSRCAQILTLSGSIALVTCVSYRGSQRAPLPRYDLQLEGGRATCLESQRDQPVHVLDHHSRLSIILRPERATRRRVSVGVVVQEQSQQLAWPVSFERTRQGTLILQGRLGELRLPCHRRCMLTLYVSDSIMLPALLSLVPDSYRSLLFPRTQTLQADVSIAPPVIVPAQYAGCAR